MRYIFGKWENNDKQITVSDISEICRQAEKQRQILADYPMDKIFRLLGKMKEKWADPNYEFRKASEGLLIKECGYSPEMIRLAFEELNAVFDPELLEKKLNVELRGLARAGDWKYSFASGSSMAWQPLGIILHVLSGNAFTVAAGSLVEGLITGNVNIFKMSSDETVFLPELIKSLVQCDEDKIVSNSVAVIDYPSSAQDVISALKSAVDGLVVWGGEEAVKAYRKDLPARTRIIVYGPKLSLAIVTGAGIADKEKLNYTAKKLAWEIMVWDQQACTAPQVCYVQGRENAEKLAEALSIAFNEASSELPAGSISTNAAVEIRKIRTVFEIADFLGEGKLFESSRNLDWTVVVDKDQTLEPSPLHRTIRIIPYENFENDVLSQIYSLRGYIQTVGLVSCENEFGELAEKLAKDGALRIVEVGQMSDGEIDDPHDGSYDLAQFVNIVFIRNSKSYHNRNPFEFGSEKIRQKVIDERLRRLIDHARLSEFYRERLSGIKINSTDDLCKIPVLSRVDMESNIPPRGTGLATKVYRGGYVSRSGGSTGEPKYSIYDGHDWEEMIQNAVRIFQIIGLNKGDRLANCFLAGDLYGSFVSFDHINYRVGLMTFAFANAVTPQTFLDTWYKFRINSIQGIPTLIAPLMREVKRLEPSFTMDKVLFAGSPMSKSDYDWMKSELGTSVIASVVGATDGGQIAFQCPEMRGSMHHTGDDFNYIEIVNDKGERVPDGQEGKIAITSLLKYAFPLIRYEIGDLGRIVPGKCSCGRNMRMMEYLGRADDIIVVGMLNVCYQDFRVALRDFSIQEFQIAAKNENGKEYIALRAETDCPSDEMKSKMLREIYRNVSKIEDQVRSGFLTKIDIEFYPPGGLPRNSRSGKLKTLVDERQ
ncbi:MAG: hypothetical protein HQM10_10840 [Candidatus Riflebacteria bacterium]|nr:hypothetical protein [Candidatus Riflebacteria bacterium]